jgi:hypothetical protein
VLGNGLHPIKKPIYERICGSYRILTATPFVPFSVKDSSSSISADDGWRSNHCELDKMFVESPTASHESPTSHTCTFSNCSASACTAHAFSIDSQPDSLKRMRAQSPASSHLNGDNSNKKQLILWQPSVAQLLERYEALSCSEVASGSSSRVLHPSQYSPREPSLSLSTTTPDPRLSMSSKLCNHAVPTRRITRSQAPKK